jgi:hypothetical protein
VRRAGGPGRCTNNPAEKLHDNMKGEVLEIQKALTKALACMQNITTILLSSSSSQLNEM